MSEPVIGHDGAWATASTIYVHGADKVLVAEVARLREENLALKAEIVCLRQRRRWKR